MKDIILEKPDVNVGSNIPIGDWQADSWTNVLSEINTLHNKKKADYANSSDRFSNFKIAAQFSGMKTYQSIENLIGVKQARLLELRGKKEPKNESLRDTLIDRAVYSILAVVWFDEEVTSHPITQLDPNKNYTIG